jgi:sugar phosphate permease
VLALLCVLLVITYLDRVCLAVAGPRMQAALHITPVQWGWITGVFTLSYAAFEIPSGFLGDRMGPRRLLTRIVLWWSLFTSLTGLVSNVNILLLVRFCFGMGEAGAYPNSGIVIARWFPPSQRTSAWGFGTMSAQIGGAIAPLLVIPIQMRYGWRASFYLFGILGVLWAIAWFGWFRDSPREMAGVSAEELAETEIIPPAHHSLPFAQGIRSANLWGVMIMAGSYGYSLYFFQSWFPTYLVKGRGFSESGLLLASLPFIIGAIANLAGGFLSDGLVSRIGLRWGRSSLSCAALASAAALMTAAMLTHARLPSLVFLSFSYGFITLQQTSVMGICLDIGGSYSGAVTGAMNTAAFAAAFLSSVIYGYIVKSHGYDAPFIPMIALLAIGSLAWLTIDATRQVITRHDPA